MTLRELAALTVMLHGAVFRRYTVICLLFKEIETVINIFVIIVGIILTWLMSLGLYYSGRCCNLSQSIRNVCCSKL